jgi:MHS family alpha-ketoglutarate permease-like MFS transporter
VFQRTASARRHHRNAFVTIMKEHRGSALRVIGISMAGNLSIYLWMVLFPTFAHLRTGLPLNVTFSAGVIAIFASLLVIPLIGNLSDRIGRRPILLTFAAGSALFAWPSLHFMAASFWNVTVIATIGMLLSSGFTATCAAVMAEQFPSEVRATGVALPYAISATVFGGTLPYIVTAMTGAGLFDYIWVYVAAVCLVGLCVYATMPETKGKLLS